MANLAEELLRLQEKEQLLDKKATRAEAEVEIARKNLFSNCKIKTVQDGEKVLKIRMKKLGQLNADAQEITKRIKEKFDGLLRLA